MPSSHQRHSTVAARTAQQGRRRLILLSALVATGSAALLAIAILLTSPSQPSPSGSPVASTAFPGISRSGYTLGSAAAPVTVDLYEDFQCPACKSWGEMVLPSLVRSEVAAGRVRLVFHDMAFLGAESSAAAKAAYAAERQDRFWDYYLALYAIQGQENSGVFSGEALRQLASNLGLDLQRFETDRNSSAAVARVQSQREAAQTLGVTATPSVAVNGHLLSDGSGETLSAALAAEGH